MFLVLLLSLNYNSIFDTFQVIGARGKKKNVKLHSFSFATSLM